MDMAWSDSSSRKHCGASGTGKRYGYLRPQSWLSSSACPVKLQPNDGHASKPNLQVIRLSRRQRLEYCSTFPASCLQIRVVCRQPSTVFEWKGVRESICKALKQQIQSQTRECRTFRHPSPPEQHCRGLPLHFVEQACRDSETFWRRLFRT